MEVSNDAKTGGIEVRRKRLWHSLRDRLYVFYLRHFCWRIYAIDWEWDRELNHLLDCNHRFHLGDNGKLILVHKTLIWIDNFPYAYGTKESAYTRESGLPSRKTVVRLHKAVEEYRNELLLEQEIKRNETLLNRV